MKRDDWLCAMAGLGVVVGVLTSGTVSGAADAFAWSAVGLSIVVTFRSFLLRRSTRRAVAVLATRPLKE